MATIDLNRDEASALRLIHLLFSEAIFPMIKGDDVTQLATARARLPGLASKIAKYCEQVEAETLDKMAEKAESKTKPKDPIKKAK